MLCETEMRESEAESMMEKMDCGGGKMLCCVCEKPFPIDELVPLSPSPYSPPACYPCASGELPE